MKLALVCNGEPGLGACSSLATELQGLGASVTLLSPSEPSSLGLPWLPLEPLAAASSDLLDELDAVGVFLEGAAVATFRRVQAEAARLRGRRPRPLFSGPIRPLCGDALAADLLPRLGYDLICVQGEAQLEELSWLLRDTPQAGQACEAIGLWCVPTQPVGHATSQQPVLLVLDQAQVPPSPFANGVLYQRLRAIALDAPGWLVRLQAESDTPLPDDPATWPETSLLWHGHQDSHRPANLHLGQPDDLPAALMQASACLGIASSWLITAMVWGKPTVVLGDYGIRTDFNGPLFFGSGTMHRLADCLPLERMLQLPGANPAWLASRGWAIADGPERLLRRLAQLGEGQP
jgi:hypothetical protein